MQLKINKSEKKGTFCLANEKSSAQYLDCKLA